MIPLPCSKRPFRHPVPAEAIEFFQHPRPGHPFAAPAWGRDSKLYVANGWVAARFFNFPASFGTGPQTTVDRLMKLPWGTNYTDKSAWRMLDDVTLDLFKEGIFDMWRGESGGYRIDPVVRINHGTNVALVSLQLISRLPRCEIYTTVDRTMPLPFRFNGGDGLISQLSHEQWLQSPMPICHLFPTVHHKI